MCATGLYQEARALEEIVKENRASNWKLLAEIGLETWRRSVTPRSQRDSHSTVEVSRFVKGSKVAQHLLGLMAASS